MPVFGNPLGLLALLGIPAVLAIHFLQRKAKELPVSTLFLLEHTRREAAEGRRFERLIPSIPLWMQLLAVLLLAWFLAEPRYPRENSVQRIAVVMDSSASMAVFRDEAAKQLQAAIPGLKGAAAGFQLTVLESVPERPRLFSGTDTDGLADALRDWQPREGPVDPTQTLRLARSLVSREGTVVYLTDTPDEAPLPFEARRLSVGEALDNVGFTGVTFSTIEGARVWKAMIRNHGAGTAKRTWSVASAAGTSEARPVEIAPGAIITVQAAFPKDQENVRAVLSGDRFPLDDVLPLVDPKPKPLVVFNSSPPAIRKLAERLMNSLEAAVSGNDAASSDLTVTSYNPLDPVLTAGNSVVFVEDETRTGAWLKGGIVAEAHPLMDGLNWQSLLARETIALEQVPGDRALLWQDKRPLILLRESESSRQLLFNFDPTLSNLEREPAFIVLLHRFAETLRNAKVATVSENLEAGQPIRITFRTDIPATATATDATGKPLTVSNDEALRRAIPTPGFMQIRQGDMLLLDAATHFGDPREADFRKCGPQPLDSASGSASVERHTRPDPLWRVWLLVLVAALLIAWRFTEPKALPA
jgi:hypothetical protein